MIRRVYFSSRLAWRQLFYDRAKLVAAILGVMFACVLVFMQMGFRDSLNTSIKATPQRINGDIFLIHKQTEAIWRMVPFDRSLLMRALGVQNVKTVYPMYIGSAQFKNMDQWNKRTIMMYGFDPDANLINIPEITNQLDKIKTKDTVLFDRASRPEFGPVAKQLAAGRNMTEINDYRVKIGGTFLMGTSFGSDGNLVTSDLNYHRIVHGSTPERVSLGVIILKDKDKIKQTIRQLKLLLSKEVRVFSHDDLIKYEQSYWQNTAPVGFIFGFGVIMGLVVGMVIVYQILFTDIANNMIEYATLKAIGYSQWYLVRVVFASATLLAVFGFIPGFVLSVVLYNLAESKIYIPFPMPLSKVITVFCFILVMCLAAAALAIRKLRSVNPADMF